MSDTKPLYIYSHIAGPNPKKVFIVLEELGIPYETEVIPDPKAADFLKINPNGRLPALKDPNHDDIIVWESGAIVEYIIENYDTKKKLAPTSFADKWHAKQYLHFQMSGQGPYFGQAAWFQKFHPVDVPEAKKRYAEQFIRVIQVLDSILEGKEYLVGNKLSYADLVFVPWDYVIEKRVPEVWNQFNIETNYPNFTTWNNRMAALSSVKKVYGV